MYCIFIIFEGWSARKHYQRQGQVITPTVLVGYDYLSLPLLPASGTAVSVWERGRTLYHNNHYSTQIAKYMGPTWGPFGADRTQVDSMLAPWALLSRYFWLPFSLFSMYKPKYQNRNSVLWVMDGNLIYWTLHHLYTNGGHPKLPWSVFRLHLQRTVVEQFTNMSQHCESRLNGWRSLNLDPMVLVGC